MIPAITANSARLRAIAGPTPKPWISEYGLKAGCAAHHGSCAVPISEPITKKTSVTIIRVLPPPTANSVPDAQPPPSCMPMPKMKEPTMTEVPTGYT